MGTSMNAEHGDEGDEAESGGGEPLVTDDEVRGVASATRSHEKSVLRRIVGLPVRGRVAGDIDAELARRGIERATPPPRNIERPVTPRDTERLARARGR